MQTPVHLIALTVVFLLVRRWGLILQTTIARGAPTYHWLLYESMQPWGKVKSLATVFLRHCTGNWQPALQQFNSYHGTPTAWPAAVPLPSCCCWKENSCVDCFFQVEMLKLKLTHMFLWSTSLCLFYSLSLSNAEKQRNGKKAMPIRMGANIWVCTLYG